MLDGELFRQGRLEMSAAPLPEFQTPAEWNDLLPNKIAIVLSVVLYTALSKVPEIHKAFWKGE